MLMKQSARHLIKHPSHKVFMLVYYFLRCFFYQGVIFFSVLTAIFASCNLFLRLPLINSASTIPLLIVAMLPLMALFALPLASSFAVYTTIAQHAMGSEFLMLSFLKPARRALHKAVGIFALSCGFIYMLLVFQYAPQSYQVGKRLLLKVAQEHLFTLEPNKFHTPFSAFTFFFKKKESSEQNRSVFSTLLLVFTPSKKQEERYCFTAQRGFFLDNKFVLHDGALYTFRSGRFHVATFAQTEIDFNQFVNNEKDLLQGSGLKFLTLRRLIAICSNDPQAFVEINKRIAQSLLQYAQPLLALFLGSILLYESMLASIFLCGSLYLLSYVLIALAQTCHHNIPLTLALFYLPIILLLIIAWLLYKRKYV